LLLGIETNGQSLATRDGSKCQIRSANDGDTTSGEASGGMNQLEAGNERPGEAVMKRTLSQAMRTRAKILDSAAQTFFRRGLARASLSDIARVAGVTRGAVYGHFKNKSALFNAMFEHAALPVDPFLIESYDNQRDPLGVRAADRI